jgi:ribosomal protein L11 methyltransferase
MISPETTLYIYEIQGDPESYFETPPPSFIGIWNEDDFCYVFFTDSQDEYIERILGPDASRLSSRHEVQYCDWQTGLPVEGIEIGNLRFVPANHVSPPAGSILLDPSVVFGDGSHPTTIRSLSFLVEILRKRSVTSLLDLGTGTGILALAGAGLGMKRIMAIDKNRLAVSVAKFNVQTNNYNSVVEVREGEARIFLDRKYDVVTANLPFEVLRDILTIDGASLHKFWIVSGISKDQGAILKDLLQEQGYEIDAEHLDHPWTTFVAVNSINC